MMPFVYDRATTAQDALRSRASEGATYVSGGTNLLDLMKLGIERPTRLVDVSRLPWRDIAASADGGLVIGSQVPNSDLAAHAEVRSRYPLLARALLAGASPQLRNKASTGGNLLQRTRCPYFYETAMACNKRAPGSGCAALEGHHRMHAILGASAQCIAVHPSDLAVALTALDANIDTIGLDGATRRLPIAELYAPPGTTPHVETRLRDGELIRAVHLPPPRATRQTYRKVRDRASYAFALVSVAAELGVREGRVSSARLALGGVAHKPWRVTAVETSLVGREASALTFEAAAQAMLADARPFEDNRFKVELARRTIVRVLTDLAQAA